MNPAGPFTSSLNSLTVGLNSSFFQLGMLYNFGLNIISVNNGSNVTVSVNWTLIMNQAPQSDFNIILDGIIYSQPSVGLLLTTNFLFNCTGWTDDNSNSAQWLYSFYYVEANTGGLQNIISNASNTNTASYVFDVRYYDLPQTMMTIYCQIQDPMGAINITSVNVLFYHN